MMRKVQGMLAVNYCRNDSHIVLDGHSGVYRFDSGFELDGTIEMGALVSLTLITVPGPNPANSYKAQFDVERIAAVHVDQPARSCVTSSRANLKLAG